MLTTGADRPVPVHSADWAPAETLDIGMNLGSTASDAYADRAPSAFTGKVEEDKFDLTQD
jgi:hypothetical protein